MTELKKRTGLDENKDSYDFYFECITECSWIGGEDVECVTRCKEKHLNQELH